VLLALHCVLTSYFYVHKSELYVQESSVSLLWNWDRNIYFLDDVVLVSILIICSIIFINSPS
jgi:hypothetical protein